MGDKGAQDDGLQQAPTAAYTVPRATAADDSLSKTAADAAAAAAAAAAADIGAMAIDSMGSGSVIGGSLHRQPDAGVEGEAAFPAAQHEEPGEPEAQARAVRCESAQQASEAPAAGGAGEQQRSARLLPPGELPTAAATVAVGELGAARCRVLERGDAVAADSVAAAAAAAAGTGGTDGVADMQGGGESGCAAAVAKPSHDGMVCAVTPRDLDGTMAVAGLPNPVPPTTPGDASAANSPVAATPSAAADVGAGTAAADFCDPSSASLPCPPAAAADPTLTDPTAAVPVGAIPSTLPTANATNNLNTTSAATNIAGAANTTGTAGTAAAGSQLLPFNTERVESVYALASEELGRGEFGVVRTCMHRTTGQLFACKSLDKARLKESARVEDLEMELYCMGIMPRHNNVVQLASVHEDERAVHLVMELCDGGDLFELIAKAGRLPEVFAAWMFRQAVEAVAFCHEYNIAHLDIKPENLLIRTRRNLPGGASAAASVALAAMGAAQQQQQQQQQQQK
ncbi:unnamed protein product [Closterium sp. Yama58-4]|nr:unnamed protein product [Closterium sp. Yama58-4]